MMIAVVAFIVLVERGERRIPVQYAKRVVGRRDGRAVDPHAAEGQRGRRDSGIFASSILAFPQPDVAAVGQEQPLADQATLRSIRHGERLYFVLFVAGIIFFCFFYVSIIFNPNEAADNRKYGGHSGRPAGTITADYMNQM